jgi:hypothetical protein
MKTIIGIIIIYIILVISSSSLMRFTMEETWKKSITIFSIGYLFVGIFVAIIFSILHFLIFVE